MRNRNVGKKLKSLCLGEIIACIAFVLCLLSFKYTLKFTIDIAIMFPFITLIIILFQGSYYWFYCLRKIYKKRVNKIIFKNTYKIFKITDSLLIGAYPIIIVYTFHSNNTLLLRGETFLGVFIYVFAILEYINYFYIRLSFSKYKDILNLLKFKNLKQSSINKELKKWRQLLFIILTNTAK